MVKMVIIKPNNLLGSTMLIGRQIAWPLCYKLTLWIITTYLSIWPGSIPKAHYTVAFELSWASYLLFTHLLHNRATAVNVESQGAKWTLSHSECIHIQSTHLVVSDVSSTEITPPHEDTPLLFKQRRYKRERKWCILLQNHDKTQTWGSAECLFINPTITLSQNSFYKFHLFTSAPMFNWFLFWPILYSPNTICWTEPIDKFKKNYGKLL